MSQCACCGLLIPEGDTLCRNCENGRPGEDLNHEPGEPHSDVCECPGCLYSSKWERLRKQEE